MEELDGVPENTPSGSRLISPDDFSLFTITEDVDEAVSMYCNFTGISIRTDGSGQDLVIRLKRAVERWRYSRAQQIVFRFV